MKSLLERPTPGAFRAVCRLPRWVLLEELLEQACRVHEVRRCTICLEQSTQSRWDKKLACNVYLLGCDLEFTDRVAYSRHLVDQHEGGLFRWDNSTLDPAKAAEVRTYRPRIPLPVKLWKPRRLTPEGKPWVDGEETETCGCGLVLELGSSEASRQYVREHLERCAGSAVAS